MIRPFSNNKSRLIRDLGLVFFVAILGFRLQVLQRRYLGRLVGRRRTKNQDNKWLKSLLDLDRAGLSGWKILRPIRQTLVRMKKMRMKRKRANMMREVYEALRA